MRRRGRARAPTAAWTVAGTSRISQVGTSRISRVEKGRVSTRDALDRYVEAPGGRLSHLADLRDELWRVG